MTRRIPRGALIVGIAIALVAVLAVLIWRGAGSRDPASLVVGDCFDVPTAAGMETVVIPAGAPLDETIAAVGAAEPTHLVGYATVVGQLARASLAGQLDIRPVRVSTNSEPWLDEDREAIREAWDAPVHNLWGSTEIVVTCPSSAANSKPANPITRFSYLATRYTRASRYDSSLMNNPSDHPWGELWLSIRNTLRR